VFFTSPVKGARRERGVDNQRGMRKLLPKTASVGGSRQATDVQSPFRSLMPIFYRYLLETLPIPYSLAAPDFVFSGASPICDAFIFKDLDHVRERRSQHVRLGPLSHKQGTSVVCLQVACCMYIFGVGKIMPQLCRHDQVRVFTKTVAVFVD
jgi:hypothetical protein